MIYDIISENNKLNLVNKTGDFFAQTVPVLDRGNRVKFFNEIMAGKKVLHYGCADWPIFNQHSNLHATLLATNPNIDGYDIDEETILKMRELSIFNGKNLFYRYEQITEKYDLLIAPETIEHVLNVEEFILQLSAISKTVLITAPNAFYDVHVQRNIATDDTFFEVVHPDHKYWFSPYTLTNTIVSVLHKNKINFTLDEIGYVEQKSMVFCMFTLTD